MYISGFEAATNANVLSGSLFEFVRRPSRISIAVMNDVVVGTNLFSFIIGDTTIARNAQIFGLTPAAGGRPLTFPHDFFIQNEPALAGDRLVLSITRGTGNQFWAVIITEVA